MSSFAIIDAECTAIASQFQATLANGPDPENPVPKIIHQIWVNENPNIPEKWKDSPVEWKAKHPDWHYVLWNGDAMRSLVEKYHPEFLATYNAYPHEIQRIDAARYVFLEAYGGLYVDLDTIPMENILSHLQCYSGVYLTNDLYPQTTFTNFLMLSQPGVPLWAEVINEMMIRSGKEYGGKFNTVLETTGPRMLSKVLGKYRGSICRLPGPVFNAAGADGATKEETLAKGAIIQNLEGWSWAPASHRAALKTYSTLKTNKWLLFFVVVIILIVAVFVWCWVTGARFSFLSKIRRPQILPQWEPTDPFGQ